MIVKPPIIISLSLLLVCYPIYGEQQRVLHDPFAKPLLKRIPRDNPKKSNAGIQLQAWSPRLTSTLRAGDNSMVIVNGQVVKLHEETDGYQLINVEETAAVFLKNSKKIRITLGDNK
jgi:hypothetical protein